MATQLDRGGGRSPASISALSDEAAHNARLVREQAAVIAHYKKMYDLSSALAKIGVWEFDLETETLTWTDGVYDLFELPRGAPIERTKIVEFYEEESRRQMERLRADAIRDGGSFTLDIRIRTAKGNDRWLRLTADVEQEAGRSIRIFGTKQDITEEKRAQQKVRSLQTELIHVSRKSAMGAMAATLAHELNQPLAAISNYAAGTRRALAESKGTDLLGTSLEAIERCALRAGAIIRSLRAMTKEGVANRPCVNPNALIREATALALAGTGDEVLVHYDLAEDVAVSVDPVQLQQILINLIANACEAMRGSSRREIAVSSRLANGIVEITVDDTGPGIAPDMVDRIFETFVSSKPDGTGLGLSISRTIVEAQGGRITAANRESGGASFRVALPIEGEIGELEEGRRSAS
jgi:two-component system, LuxR family, sensor kinase FixL